MANIALPYELFTQIELLSNLKLPPPKKNEPVAVLLFVQWQAACHTLSKPHKVPTVLRQVT